MDYDNGPPRRGPHRGRGPPRGFDDYDGPRPGWDGPPRRGGGPRRGGFDGPPRPEFDGPGPGGPPNPLGALGGLFGGGQQPGLLTGLLGNFNLGGLGQNLDMLLSGVTELAANALDGPSNQWKYPPHQVRRLVRFCSKQPQNKKCQGIPPKLKKRFQKHNDKPPPNIGGLNMWEKKGFTGLKQIKRPPIRKVNRPNIMANVPSNFNKFVPKPTLGELDMARKSKMMAWCSSGKACNEQPDDAIEKRASIADGLLAFQYFLTPQSKVEQLDEVVETNLMRTMQVKEALIKSAGLTGKVDPINDGTFQHDVLLTEEQATSMINNINDNNLRRVKRSALFLEGVPTSKWPNNAPIPYAFDTTMTEPDKQVIKQAIQEIESKTCVRFKFSPTKPNGAHLYYIKYASGTFCGLSYIGRILPANPIYLSFACANSKGVAVHETLHALGLNHEQLRGDRNDFITVNYENINPQQYDFFAVVDSKQFTSYGVEYDYGSIMHYEGSIASSNGKQTMTAKINPAANQPKMGQRNGMSSKDVEVIQKMFCMPGCDDKNIYCGHWSLKKLCGSASESNYMTGNCQKSCNFCGVH
uniref:Metalloendopeptidase n=1 Tax=Rhabditophanes sp. KR3021 TaxID=114890 RepID=A0AC35U9A3_9BILA